jgi:hypothetical protein
MFGEVDIGSSSSDVITKSPTSYPTKQQENQLLSLVYLGVLFIGIVLGLVLCYRCFCKSNENKKRMVNVFAES